MSDPIRAYFTSADQYVRYEMDPEVDRVADGYPKQIDRGWAGMTQAIRGRRLNPQKQRDLRGNQGQRRPRLKA